MNLKLILKNNFTIDLADASITQHFYIICEDKEQFMEIWDEMNPENLTEVKIMQDEDIINVIYGMKVNGIQIADNPNGTFTAHFYTEGGEYVVDKYAEAGRILLGEEV